MKRFKRFSWLSIGFLLLSACASQAVETPIPPSTDMPAAPTEAGAESIFGPGTFNMILPLNWDVAGPETISDDSGRTYRSYSLGEDPTSSGGPGMSHVIIASAAEWTPEDLALMQCSTCPDNGFEQVTVGGKPALRTQVGGGGVPMMITWYFVESQGNLIAFAIHDPQTLEPLQEVIESIGFAE